MSFLFYFSLNFTSCILCISVIHTNWKLSSYRVSSYRRINTSVVNRQLCVTSIAHFVVDYNVSQNDKLTSRMTDNSQLMSFPDANATISLN